VLSEIAEQVLPERETAEAMFRLLLLTVREIERAGGWQLPLAYFAFWTVRLGGYLPRFDRCAKCGTAFGERPAFHAPWEAGLLCEKCKRSGMRPLQAEGRRLAERFAGERLDRLENWVALERAAGELREAALDWIEQHTEKQLKTRTLLETT
jgi:DNA repair protein RecO